VTRRLRRIAPSRRARVAPLLGLAAALHGCVTLNRNRLGDVPPTSAVAAVPEGASVGEVLARLGAPVEWWQAPDALLLIWREWHYDYDRFELDPSQPLGFTAIDPFLGSLLENLRLVLERGTLREERVAVLFDRDGRVIAVAHRDGDGARLR
jgi:hypothetical protein